MRTTKFKISADRLMAKCLQRMLAEEIELQIELIAKDTKREKFDSVATRSHIIEEAKRIINELEAQGIQRHQI